MLPGYCSYLTEVVATKIGSWVIEPPEYLWGYCRRIRGYCTSLICRVRAYSTPIPVSRVCSRIIEYSKYATVIQGYCRRVREYGSLICRLFSGYCSWPIVVNPVVQLTFDVNRQKTTEDAISYLNNWIDDYWPATVTREEPADQTTVLPDTSTVPLDYGEVLGMFENPRPNSGSLYWGTVESDPADQTTTVPTDTSTVPPEVLGRFDNPGPNFGSYYFGEVATVSREPADQITVALEGTVPLEESTVAPVTVGGPVRGKRAVYYGKTQEWEDEWFRMDLVEMRSIFWKIDRQYKNNFIQVEPAFLDEVVYKHTWKKPYWEIRSSLNEYAQHWYKFPPIKEKLDRWFLNYQC
ncbi:hypothetical protein CAEBREN_14883 [Caenorhabditis brenneri]|uniref:Uncharacterized protein n=1 Tax=Caenorhabditis brenneri TaxID=135651 RepID=G0MVU5_CAEBE|nr:hypothetical protein CAEBREN_14883 [Caenorhabditis brenneri]